MERESFSNRAPPPAITGIASQAVVRASTADGRHNGVVRLSCEVPSVYQILKRTTFPKTKSIPHTTNPSRWRTGVRLCFCFCQCSLMNTMSRSGGRLHIVEDSTHSRGSWLPAVSGGDQLENLLHSQVWGKCLRLVFVNYFAATPFHL